MDLGKLYQITKDINVEYSADGYCPYKDDGQITYEGGILSRPLSNIRFGVIPKGSLIVFLEGPIIQRYENSFGRALTYVQFKILFGERIVWHSGRGEGYFLQFKELEGTTPQ